MALHNYTTPKGEFYTERTQGGTVTYGIRWNPGFGPDISQRLNNAQEYIDYTCLRLCQDYVPKDTGTLINSGILNTQIGSGEVKYRTPYARRWYYMPANFDQGSGSGRTAVGRGNYWFYRMVAEHKKDILNGAKDFMK